MEATLSHTPTLPSCTTLQKLAVIINADLAANLETQWYRHCTEDSSIHRHIQPIAQASSNPNIPIKTRGVEAFEAAPIQLIVESTEWELAGCLFAFEHQNALWIQWLSCYEVWGAYTAKWHRKKKINAILSTNLRKYIWDTEKKAYAISHTPWIHEKRKDAWWAVISFSQLKSTHPEVYITLIDTRDNTYALWLSPALAESL
jgi:hypothetical protein